MHKPNTVVVGYGFAGAISAIEAAHAGAKLLLIEKASVTGAHVSEDVVYKTTKTLYNNKKALALAFGVFNRMVPKEMPSKHSNPYHPGAIKVYKEVGLWPQTM